MYKIKNKKNRKENMIIVLFCDNIFVVSLISCMPGADPFEHIKIVNR